MPRGGRREGAGRKARDGKERRVRGFRLSDDEFDAVTAFLLSYRSGGTAAPVADHVTAKAAETALTSRTAASERSAGRKTRVKLKNGLTPSQSRALALMESGANVLLTGGAGVGKTFLLHKFITGRRKSTIVCAMSGIAAKRAGGATIHRTFKLPVKILEESKFKPDNFLLDDEERQELFNSNDKHTAWLRALLTADTLVVDEISMCRSDVFAYMMRVVRVMAQGRKADDAAGVTEVRPHKIQVILCGDFFQLAPIIGGTEKDAWKAIYPHNAEGWAFKDPEWDKMNFHVAELTEVVRQENPEDAAALNAIRRGDAAGLEYINSHCASSEQDGPFLAAKKTEAATANEKKYKSLRGKERIFDMIQSGEVNKGDIVCDETLRLKLHARVLFLTNDKDGSYQNGSYGEVVGFGKLPDGSEVVKVEVGGTEVAVERYTWTIEKYDVETETGKDGKTHKSLKLQKVGEYSQFPLRLGYSLTIHKAQGQDYERCNILRPSSIWASGQLYVALSRAEDISKLYLGETLTAKMLHTSAAVKEFYSNLT